MQVKVLTAHNVLKSCRTAAVIASIIALVIFATLKRDLRGLDGQEDGGQCVAGEGRQIPYETKPQGPELLFTLNRQLHNLHFQLQRKGLSRELQARSSFLINTVYKITQLRETTRRTEVDELSVKIQNRLRQLQNPNCCDVAKKMVCLLTNQYGFGGMVHHMAACYNIGLATNRVVLFHYKLGNHYKDVLMNGSKCSVDLEKAEAMPLLNGKKAPSLPFVSFDAPLWIRDDMFPTDALPRDVAPHIQSFHGLPVAWFQGQIVKYIMRPTDQLLLEIEQVVKRINFSTPILGLQVRRTDKGDRNRHLDEEYMELVDAWFESNDQRRILSGDKPLERRRIFLAADTIATVKTFRENYGGYEFINNLDASEFAEIKQNRNENKGLLGIMVDMYLLSRCSHLVCDGNSNVCRVAVELMQTQFVDASTMFTPIGEVYHNVPYVTPFERVLNFTKEQVPERNPWRPLAHFNNHMRRITKVLPVNVVCRNETEIYIPSHC